MVFSLFWAPHCQINLIKLGIHGSILNSILVIMNELKFILLTGVFTKKFNNMDLVKFLEKNSKTSHLDCSGHIEGDVM